MASLEQLVIIGAGHAAGRAAEHLALQGYPAKIIVLGEESHPSYERPALSKALLAGNATVESTYVRPADFYAQHGIEVRTANVVREIDRGAQRVVLASGPSIPYDRLLIATGARPRRLNLHGATGERVRYLRTIDDSIALRGLLKPQARVVVIGAGLIGLEVAATARTLGAHVVVLEAATHAASRVLPLAVARRLAKLHETQGNQLRFEASLSSITEMGSHARVELADRSLFEADVIVVGIGCEPNVELASNAGLRCQDGILTDAFGRSSDEHIFAAGDVCRFMHPAFQRPIRLESWHNAQNQAIAVAKIIAGGAEPYMAQPWMWTDQFSLNLQVSGAPSSWNNLVWRGNPEGERFIAFTLQSGRVAGCIGWNAGREMREARALVESSAQAAPTDLADGSRPLRDLLGGATGAFEAR